MQLRQTKLRDRGSAADRDRRQHRSHHGTHRGRAGALEFADLRQHLGRQIYTDTRQRRAQRLADAPLMRIVQEREQERHGDRLQPRLADRLDQRRQFILGQWRDNLALRIDPFGDLEPPAPRHQHRGRILQQIVQIGARRPPQFQDIAHAARRDEAGARALVLQQRVGDHRGGMRQQRYIGRIDAVGIQPLADAVDHRLAEILRRGRQFGDGDAAGVLLHQGDVGEGAADIDADPPRHAMSALVCSRAA